MNSNRMCRATAVGVLTMLLGALFFVAPASAAPSLGIDLSNDANELLRIAVSASAGQLRVTLNAETTGDLPVGTSAEEVQAALNSLPSISSGGGSVSVDSSTGAGGSEYYVTFDGGPLGHADVPQLAAADGVTPLSGLSSKVTTATLDPAGVSRSDKRVDYTVDVTSTADALVDPVPGEALSCYRGIWSEAGKPDFTYQWLRNGAPIAGATGKTYTLGALDAGTVVQCQVTGINLIADESDSSDFAGSTVASAGSVVVSPAPAIDPPIPPEAVNLFASGNLDHTADEELTCEAGEWQNAPAEFVYRWYRNGVALGGSIGPTPETSAKLTLTVAEQSPPAQFQCSVSGINAGGARTSTSFNQYSSAPEINPFLGNSEKPNVVPPGEVNGESTVVVELPGGQETVVYKTSGIGWACVKAPAAGLQPATATCARTDSDPLASGASYPPLEVVAGLGADAPDHAIAVATVTGGGIVSPAVDTDEFEFTPARAFEISDFDTAVSSFGGADFREAGGHPFSASTTFRFPRYRSIAEEETNPVKSRFLPSEQVKDVVTDLPRGFVGNALAVPDLCPGLAQVAAGTCPPKSVVGGITLDVSGFGTGLGPLAVYAIEPEFGKPAQFGFAEGNSHTIYSFAPRLRADDGYAITLEAAPIPLSPLLFGVEGVTLCSFGANTKPGTGDGVLILDGCKKPDDPSANPKPLITNPTRCAGRPPTTMLRVDSWEHPGVFKTKESVDPSPTNCGNVEFQPKIDLQPTSRRADSPTGLDVEITMPTEGLESPTGISQANIDNVTVTLPQGMSVNPAASQGLGSCSPEQVKLGSNADDECPLSSRIGTVEVDTPLIRETLTGRVYVASQRDNPFKSTLGIYLVFSSKKDGITIKVAGKLVPDPETGQLTSVFTESPEAPFSKLALHFNSGPRAPLINPPTCDNYPIHSELSPWSAADPVNPTAAEVVSSDSTYAVTSGPNGGPCPRGGLEPKLEAGLRSPRAGAKSPFVLKLSREDGTQRFTALDLSLPPGLTAYLRGVPYCPDSVLAAISGAEGAGRAELASPVCPAASQVGSIQAGAGAGPYPFYAPGRAYLAGPYKGAPLSLAMVAPAVAGPFDLGNVVVRNALYIDPVTAQVTVRSEPIPTILHGLLLDVRDLRVSIDRPGFTAAPTSCEPMSIGAQVTGAGSDLRSSADDTVAHVSTGFQVGGCEDLGFKPRLALHLFGGTHRSAHPRLVAKLTARAGDANIAGASVALPHSEFLDQAHIRTICTRVQFAAARCPAGAIYGRAEARTPLLDSPVKGPVYLRSSDNALPDMVAALRGPDNQPVEVVLSGRIDSVHGGIRSSFEAVPDQPVSSFVLRMRGGKKGLLVNSRDICKSVNRATAKFVAHNGRIAIARPKLKSDCHQGAQRRRHPGR